MYLYSRRAFKKITQSDIWIVLHLDFDKTVEKKQIQITHLIIPLPSSLLQAQTVSCSQQEEITGFTAKMKLDPPI